MSNSSETQTQALISNILSILESLNTSWASVVLPNPPMPTIESIDGTDRKRVDGIPHLFKSALRFSFHFAFGELTVYFNQEILCFKHDIFGLKEPISDAWISELLLFCIINH
ncbi:hypothetical protein CR513_37486, partial [Mucuna pruriens]